jgi:hypothetical protein
MGRPFSFHQELSMAESNTVPTWGYSKKDAKIFNLKEGESLPKGYYDSPAAMEDAETKPDQKSDKA